MTERVRSGAERAESEWLEGLRYEDKFACERCHGDGIIPVNPGYPDPQTETDATCPDCHGTGVEEKHDEESHE